MPHSTIKQPTPPLPTELAEALQSQLSSKSTLLLLSSPDFFTTTERWTEYQGPKFSAVVLAGSEPDIQTTIELARAHSIPFLVSTAKHGDFADLAQIQGGIQIDLSRLNTIEIIDNGQHALIGGGIISMNLTKHLWDVGKVTVTGVCETVGIGLHLSGGHGILQGLYGLACDQIVSARLILADSRIITVSASEEPELFWALKGAGGCFGVVTQMTIKIHDAAPVAEWGFELRVFGAEMVERVIEAVDRMQREGTHKSMQVFVMFKRIPEVGGNETLILVFALSTTDLSSFTKPLQSIPTLSTTTNKFPYPMHPSIFEANSTSRFCSKGYTFRRHALDIPSLSPTSARKAHTLLDSALTAHPEFVEGSSMIFEGYACPPRIDAESTGFPWRGDNWLVTPFFSYTPDERLDLIARDIGERIRRVVYEGSGREEMHVYLNYASGLEGLESLFGYEKWRLERLRALKDRFDPERCFRFYGGKM